MLMFYDLEKRELLRTWSNPLTAEHVRRLRGLQPGSALHTTSRTRPNTTVAAVVTSLAMLVWA